MGVMIFFWLLILTLIGALIWFFVLRGSESSASSENESSLEVLKKRYARGVINEEEFNKMKKEISE